jgi:hypothetical protein
MPNRIAGLESFGLRATDVRRLADRKCHVSISLRTYEVTPAVLRLRPPERHPYLEARVRRWLPTIERALSGRVLECIPNRRLPSRIETDATLREISKVARLPGVEYVHPLKIAGFRRRPHRAAKLCWYCVRARVAVQVEGMATGVQTIEDRFVVVQATSSDDAGRRLGKPWAEYAKPYLNSKGCLVRWQLEKVVDVCSTGEEALDPRGTEVYSRLYGRRMKPEFVWKPAFRGPR